MRTFVTALPGDDLLEPPIDEHSLLGECLFGSMVLRSLLTCMSLSN